MPVAHAFRLEPLRPTLVEESTVPALQHRILLSKIGVVAQPNALVRQHRDIVVHPLDLADVQMAVPRELVAMREEHPRRQVVVVVNDPLKPRPGLTDQAGAIQSDPIHPNAAHPPHVHGSRVVRDHRDDLVGAVACSGPPRRRDRRKRRALDQRGLIYTARSTRCWARRPSRRRQRQHEALPSREPPPPRRTYADPCDPDSGGWKAGP
mmetsp:Transcript_37822/g.114246  ORF Transcript_37822/g.114246 Transcript_37822/m.114246 type:complete len:208 (+) Transcript_37822:410-1033(+)